MPHLEVATFNIRHGKGLDGVVDLARTARCIRDSGAEFVALQELDRGLARTDRVDQPGRLADLLDMDVRFFPTVEKKGGEYGIAVASRDDFEARFFELPRNATEEPRGAIVATWRGITVVTTHLSLWRETRYAQVMALADLVGPMEGPVVLMGDLNSLRWNLGPLKRVGLTGGPGWRSTMARRPWSEIDHVLAGHGAAVTEVRTLSVDASDHLPLAATIEVPEPL